MQYYSKYHFFLINTQNSFVITSTKNEKIKKVFKSGILQDSLAWYGPIFGCYNILNLQTRSTQLIIWCLLLTNQPTSPSNIAKPQLSIITRCKVRNMMIFSWDFGPKSFRDVFNWPSFTFLYINSTSQWTRQLGYFHIAITKLWKTSNQEQDPRKSPANDQTACKWHLIPHPKKKHVANTIPYLSPHSFFVHIYSYENVLSFEVWSEF